MAQRGAHFSGTHFSGADSLDESNDGADPTFATGLIGFGGVAVTRRGELA